MNRAYELAKTAKDSRVPEFLDTYGQVCYKLGKLDEAEKALNSAVYKKPRIAIFRYHLAKVYIEKNNREKARQALEAALNNSKNQQFEQRDEVRQLLNTL
jgi:predicted Zn-dependent protease